MEHLDSEHDNTLVIAFRITTVLAKWILINTGSTIDILYYDAFQKIGLFAKDLQPISSTHTRFTRDSITLLGIIDLYVISKFDNCSKIMKIKFLMVNISYAYNAIKGHVSHRCLVSQSHE